MTKTNSYSALFIINPDKKDTVKDVASTIKSIISENSGSITNENMMGKKTLAYPIKKKNEGIYLEVVFNAPPENVANMMRQFQINIDLLRTLIDRTERKK